MTDKVIDYKSAEKTVDDDVDTLETINRDGIVCTWCGKIVDENYTGWYEPNFSWNFDWSQLENRGVERITGYLIVKGTSNSPNFGEHKVDIDFKETPKTVTKDIEYNDSRVYVTFEYHLTPHYNQKIEKISYDEMFAASEMNDTVLVIGRKKVHVNKVFLSYHSEFFRVLFSSNSNDDRRSCGGERVRKSERVGRSRGRKSAGADNLSPPRTMASTSEQMTEIPIKDVTYEDFGLLMSAVYPNTVFPNDDTVEKLLELADRFQMPSVTAHVEYHLLNLSGISNEKMIWMADKYGMPTLLEKAIRLLDTVEKSKKLKASPEYGKWSKDAKSKVLDRLMQLI